MSLQDKFSDFYANLTVAKLDQLNKIYTPDVTFIDPVAVHNGMSAVYDYFYKLVNVTEYCQFTIFRFSESHQTTAQAHCVAVEWRMDFASKKLLNGKQLSLHGMSMLDISGELIVQQRDYYDMGEMLYEHTPVLGTVVRFLKHRLASQ